jgi:hypothetical protein
VIRRFEIYRIRAEAPSPAVEALATACRRAGQFIPEVLYSAVGWNGSDAPAHLIWEHAFTSPEAYRRYMVHPFHANVLDRYLLHDSPERVVVDDGLGAGLVGYHCDGPVFALSAGVRRLVLLRIDGDASTADVQRLTDRLGRAPATGDGVTLSVVGANTLGSAWFDGVTPMGRRPRWTHLWEQGFAGPDALDAYLTGPSALAQAEREGWGGWSDGIIERSASLHYRLDGARP